MDYINPILRKDDRIISLGSKKNVISNDIFIFGFFNAVFQHKMWKNSNEKFINFIFSEHDNVILFLWYYHIQKTESKLKIISFICREKNERKIFIPGLNSFDRQVYTLLLSLINLVDIDKSAFKKFLIRTPSGLIKNIVDLMNPEILQSHFTNLSYAYPVFYLICDTISQLKLSGFITQANHLEETLLQSSKKLSDDVISRDILLNEQWFAKIGHLNVLPYFLYANGLQGKKVFIRANKQTQVSNKYLLNLILDQTNVSIEIFRGRPEFILHNQSNCYFFTKMGLLNNFDIESTTSSFGFKLQKPRNISYVKEQLLQKIGLKNSSKIVTINTRSRKLNSGSTNELRSVDPLTYVDGIQYLISKGYTVIRLGDKNQEKIPQMEGFFDYPTSTFKSEINDILIICSADFHIGSSSGISLIPLTFGIPTLMLNWFPRRDIPWGEKTEVVHKNIFDKINGIKITDDFSLRQLGNITSERALSALGLEVKSLTPSEILFHIQRFEKSLKFSKSDINF